MRLLLSGIFFCLALTVHGQVVDSSSFAIRIFAGNDTTPPPVPTITSVTPVASTQIDVTWGAVIDDVFLAGYVLYRDDVAIATTTLTNFSDTGLLASTTYGYSVQAFDAAGNYSATSTTVATTTLPTPPPVATSTPTSTTSQSGTAARAALENFSLSVTDQTATLNIDTAFPTRIEVRWGRGASYELGYSTTDAFLRSFSTTITELEPGTRYEYEIIGVTPRGQETVLRRGQFITESVTAATPPNVRFLRAIPVDTDVALTWVLPDIDVAAVRVVRSHLGFPTTPNDGAIVYQGKGESFTDSAILDRYSPVYYTVFVYDPNGSISSGAVVQVALEDDGAGVVLNPTTGTGEQDLEPEGIEVLSPQATTTEIEVATSSLVRIPSLEEIFIIHGGETYSFASPDITIPISEHFTVAVPVTAVSKNLKTILLTLTDPSDTTETYSYILRLNKDGSAYESRISGFDEAGRSAFTVAVYDFETRMISRYRKQVRFGEVARGQGSVFFPDYFLDRPLATGLGVTGFLILLIFMAALSRRSQ